VGFWKLHPEQRIPTWAKTVTEIRVYSLRSYICISAPFSPAIKTQVESKDVVIVIVVFGCVCFMKRNAPAIFLQRSGERGHCMPNLHPSAGPHQQPKQHPQPRNRREAKDIPSRRTTGHRPLRHDKRTAGTPCLARGQGRCGPSPIVTIPESNEVSSMVRASPEAPNLRSHLSTGAGLAREPA